MTDAAESYDAGLRNLCKSQANKTSIFYGEAIRDFTKALAADPGMARAHALRAVCHEALGEMDAASADRAAAAQLEIATPPLADTATAKTLCARARNGMETGGLISESLYYLYRAIDADPGHADAYDARSDLYFNLGLAEASMADIRRVGELNRHAAKPWWKFW